MSRERLRANMVFRFIISRGQDWKTYGSCLDFAETVRDDVEDLGPRDMIDLQSFIWVQGSSEYDE